MIDLSVLPMPRAMFAVVLRSPKKRGGGMTKEKWLYHGKSGELFIYHTRKDAQKMVDTIRSMPYPRHPERIYSVRPFWGEP